MAFTLAHNLPETVSTREQIHAFNLRLHTRRGTRKDTKVNILIKGDGTLLPLTSFLGSTAFMCCCVTKTNCGAECKPQSPDWIDFVKIVLETQNELL